MFCDILQPDGSPYPGDPRYVLKRVLARAAEKGFTFFAGPELEFFYFRNNKAPEVLDEGGYFDAPPLDAGNDLRRQTIFALEKLGVRIEYSHHVVTPSQHEIDLRYKDALAMADTVMTYKITVKEIARRYGYHASFMPKPIFGQNGSGMHVHQSLFQGKRNVMFDAGDPYHLSDEGKYYIAGLLKHALDITVKIARLATETNLFPLYEVEAGCYRINRKVANPKPLSEYLKPQGRFRHLTAEEVALMQSEVERNWLRLLKLEAAFGTQ